MTAPSTSPTRPLDTDGPAGAGPRGAGLDAGLLLLRIAVGAIMAAHGAQKLFGWFGGGGIDGTAQFFTSVGYPAGEAMATVAALTETFGGLALILGLLTPLAAAAVTGTQGPGERGLPGALWRVRTGRQAVAVRRATAAATRSSVAVKAIRTKRSPAGP
ncbi:DoxX family protein [Streptomyces sp. S5]|uniref:DoxX family protein n=1 Tax=Streptomyces sp. S5 TaxID=1456735 RepID=UPI001F092819|nr:DoxX family protein [Streptomyces sp. S5]